MNRLSITINDREYQLATTLRVAFKVQGMHGHKPYIEIFQSMSDMPVEQQIGIIWAAFEVQNPDEAKAITQIGFQNYVLDHLILKDLMEILQSISAAMMGEDKDQDNSETPQTGE